MTPDMIIKVDMAGNQLEELSLSELRLRLESTGSADVRAVLRARRRCTAFTVAGYL